MKCAPAGTLLQRPSRNVEWGGGVQLAAKGFAVDLTAQTGYSKADTVRFKWANNYKGRGYFCGQFAVPTRDDPDTIVGSMIGS